LQPATSSQPRDLAFLLQPQNFQTVPRPLGSAEPAKPSRASLPDLVQNGRYYSAAVLCARLLSDLPASSAAQTIFDLWYTRLACLTVIHQTTIAATESKVLGDLTSSFYRDPDTNAHIVPWQLRVLCVRLQALGFGEWRRGIMAYYVLAEEAREEAAAAKTGPKSTLRLWKARLHELGILVASALVEMGDHVAAIRHLKTLGQERDVDLSERQKICFMEALLWLKIGDVAAASGCLSHYPKVQDTDEVLTGADDGDNEFKTKVLSALIQTCDGDYLAAAEEWLALSETCPDDGIIQQNLAVCLLYTCEMKKSREMLESLIKNKDTPIFESLLMNLATVYELSSENSQAAKTDLAERVSRVSYDGSSQERFPANFKLEVR
jgi:hypothetical protein